MKLIKKIFYVNDKFCFKTLLYNLLLPLVGGFLISFFIKNSIDLYDNIEKPFFAPPDFLFGIVWPILYLLMGFSAYRISMLIKQGVNDKNAYFYYLIKLCLNFIWPIIFFNLRLFGVSFVEIIVLLVFIIITSIKFYKLDKFSGILMIPYILWVSYASVLSFFIYMLNEL